MDTSFKDRLSLAFKNLRKLGVVARQNFRCCQSCAGYEIGTYIEEQRTEGNKKGIVGYVFYHHQDTESAFGKPDSSIRSDREGDGELYLAYGDASTAKFDSIVGEWTSTNVGKLIESELKNVGLKVEWDGNHDTRILVIVKGE